MNIEEHFHSLHNSCKLVHYFQKRVISVHFRYYFVIFPLLLILLFVKLQLLTPVTVNPWFSQVVVIFLLHEEDHHDVKIASKINGCLCKYATTIAPMCHPKIHFFHCCCCQLETWYFACESAYHPEKEISIRACKKGELDVGGWVTS